MLIMLTDQNAIIRKVSFEIICVVKNGRVFSEEHDQHVSIL